MAYLPHFRITPLLLGQAEEIAALREKIRSAAESPAWIPALQKDTRARNAHASTALEGNPLNLERVRALEDGHGDSGTLPRAEREIRNWFAGFRYLEKRAKKPKLVTEDLFELHRLLAAGALDPDEAGRYRGIAVRIGRFTPPPPDELPLLVSELLEWWNKDSARLSPVLSAAILHFRFEAIHPFGDGNGRMARALALWELYRRGFDAHHLFPVDEYHREDRSAYLRHQEAVRKEGEDLTEWLEYYAEGLRRTLERTWIRAQALHRSRGERLILKPRQEELLHLLRIRGALSPREIWDSLGITKQGGLQLLHPLLSAGMVERVGGRKTGKYLLKGP
jgi:Fic family protein